MSHETPAPSAPSTLSSQQIDRLLDSVQQLLARQLTFGNSQANSTNTSPHVGGIAGPEVVVNQQYMGIERTTIPQPDKLSADQPSQTTVNNFIFAVENYLHDVYPDSAYDPPQKARLVANFLTGASKTWYRQATRHQPFASPTALFDALRKHFIPDDYVQTLRDDLKHCVQGVNESIEMYHRRFMEIVLELDSSAPSQEELVRLFTDGCKANIRQCSFITTVPTSVDDARIIALRAQRNLRPASKALAQPPPAPLSSVRPGGPKMVQAVKKALHAMGFAPTSMPPTPTPAPPLASPGRPPLSNPRKLTAEERQRLLESGGCFRCRQQGHLASVCPNFPPSVPPSQPPATPPKPRTSMASPSSSRASLFNAFLHDQGSLDDLTDAQLASMLRDYAGGEFAAPSTPDAVPDAA